MTDIPKIADRIDPRTQHFECGKKSLHVQVPLADLITASDALRAAQGEIEKLREALKEVADTLATWAADHSMECTAHVDAVLHTARAALTSKDQHHG